jgi:hypothetical protein
MSLVSRKASACLSSLLELLGSWDRHRLLASAPIEAFVLTDDGLDFLAAQNVRTARIGDVVLARRILSSRDNLELYIC